MVHYMVHKLIWLPLLLSCAAFRAVLAAHAVLRYMYRQPMFCGAQPPTARSESPRAICALASRRQQIGGSLCDPEVCSDASPQSR